MENNKLVLEYAGIHDLSYDEAEAAILETIEAYTIDGETDYSGVLEELELEIDFAEDLIDLA